MILCGLSLHIHSLLIHSKYYRKILTSVVVDQRWQCFRDMKRQRYFNDVKVIFLINNTVILFASTVSENVTSWQLTFLCGIQSHSWNKINYRNTLFEWWEDSVSDEAISRGWEFSIAPPHWLVSEAAQTPWDLPVTLLRHDSSDQALLR